LGIRGSADFLRSRYHGPISGHRVTERVGAGAALLENQPATHRLARSAIAVWRALSGTLGDRTPEVQSAALAVTRMGAFPGSRVASFPGRLSALVRRRTAGRRFEDPAGPPFDRFLHSPGWILLFGLFAIIIGPLFEEMIFRGFMQPLLTRDLGIPAGIILTAAIFGLLHAPEYSGAWQYVVLVGFAGACFGWVRVRGRSLIPSAIMHAGFNFIFFLAALFQNRIQK
jgi:membrane protease YdiL (CAAX protease family)